MEESLAKDPNEVVPYRILQPVVDVVNEVVRSRLALFDARRLSEEKAS